MDGLTACTLLFPYTTTPAAAPLPYLCTMGTTLPATTNPATATTCSYTPLHTTITAFTIFITLQFPITGQNRT